MEPRRGRGLRCRPPLCAEATFSDPTGAKNPRLQETFAGPPYSFTNTALKPESVRAFEAGFQQNFFNGKYVLNATYFNNLFHNQINYVEIDLVNFIGQYQ